MIDRCRHREWTMQLHVEQEERSLLCRTQLYFVEFCFYLFQFRLQVISVSCSTLSFAVAQFPIVPGVFFSCSPSDYSIFVFCALAALHDVPCCTSVDRHYRKIPLHACTHCSAETERERWTLATGPVACSPSIFTPSNTHTHIGRPICYGWKRVGAQFMLRDCIHYLADTKKCPCAESTFYWPTTRPVQIF